MHVDMRARRWAFVVGFIWDILRSPSNALATPGMPSGRAGQPHAVDLHPCFGRDVGVHGLGRGVTVVVVLLLV